MDHRFVDQRGAGSQRGRRLQGQHDGDPDAADIISPQVTSGAAFFNEQYLQPASQLPNQPPSQAAFDAAPPHARPPPSVDSHPPMMPAPWQSASYSSPDAPYAYQSAPSYDPSQLPASMQPAPPPAFPTPSPISASTTMQPPPGAWSIPHLDTSTTNLASAAHLATPDSATTFIPSSATFMQSAVSSAGGWAPPPSSDAPRWSHDVTTTHPVASAAAVASPGGGLGVGFLAEPLPSEWSQPSSTNPPLFASAGPPNPMGGHYWNGDLLPWPSQAQLQMQQQQQQQQQPPPPPPDTAHHAQSYRTEQLNHPPPLAHPQPQHPHAPLYSEQAAAPLEMTLTIRGNTPERIREGLALAPPMDEGEGKARFDMVGKRGRGRKGKAERQEKHVHGVVSRRTGPLSQAQRDKADEMRYYGACWRCRRYRKPCDAGPGGICTSCRTSGFRVWPSSIGCRRGDAADIIRQVIPPVAEEVLADLAESHVRTPNWRTNYGFVIVPSDMMTDEYAHLALTKPAKGRGKKALGAVNVPSEATLGVRGWWDEVARRVRTTGVFGSELDELIDIAKEYQAARDTEVPILSACSNALAATVDFYHTFVLTANTFDESEGAPAPNPFASAEGLRATVATLRQSLNTAWKACLTAAIQGRRSTWLPAFLSICIYVPSQTILLDATLAVPAAARAAVWRDIRDLFKDIRQKHYAMAIDLLRILARGAWPLGLNCWGYVEAPASSTSNTTAAKATNSQAATDTRKDSHQTENDTAADADASVTLVRDPEGLKLVDGDIPSFDGFCALKAWGKKYQDVFQTYGSMLYGRAPFEDTVAIAPPITALFRVFEEGASASTK